MRHRLLVFCCVSVYVGACGREPLNPAGIDPARALHQIISNQQSAHIRESWGPSAGECYTAIDLKRFMRDGGPLRIAKSLKGDRLFLETVLRLRALTPPDRRALLRQARVPLHPTWAQLGSIDRRGQTEAGQQGELLIADAIVTLLGELAESATAEDIQALWSGGGR